MKSRFTIQMNFSGFGMMQTIIFALLKMCGAITWQWGWVFFPFVITFGITFIVKLVQCLLDYYC